MRAEMLPSGVADVIRSLRSRRAEEELAARQNPFLVEALRKEKHEGQRIAAWARTVALVASGILIAFQNANWSVLYFHALLLVFIAVGWAQLRYATVGHSRVELALIMADLVLLAVALTTPFLLAGKIEMLLQERSALAGIVRAEPAILRWMLFTEGGGRWLLAIVLALLVIALIDVVMPARTTR